MFNKAIALKPNHPAALSDLGIALKNHSCSSLQAGQIPLRTNEVRFVPLLGTIEIILRPIFYSSRSLTSHKSLILLGAG
jgi:hypothetical protein